MDVPQRIAPSADALAAVCQRFGVHRLALFGSVLRSDFGPNSDVDVLIEFEPGRTPGYFRIFELEQELSHLFGERRVEARTAQELSRHFRDDVVRHSRTLYVAA
ncbi:MAG: nucleotidyltransferase [Planctomycetota bacterium]|nr:MAG: nucleotidyltransferase [Planctomycetota bacterium]